MEQVKDTLRALVRIGFDGRVYKTFRGPKAEERFANEVKVLKHLEARGCDFVPFRNVMETIGLARPDEIVAGQEPDRDWLTDPPKGYRVPTATTVATQDIKPKVNDADPRTALYHPPEN